MNGKQYTDGLEELTYTWERLIPKQIADDPASQQMLRFHYQRYETAAQHVQGKRVLDIACGAGYGSQMLGLAGADAVLGVDVCPQTVQYAQKHYQVSSVQFVCADAEQFEWTEPFDVVVSFETIEHLHHPTNFLERIRRLLAPEGKFLLSVPLGETRHLDRYHLQIFSLEGVLDLLAQTGFSVNHYHCEDYFMNRSDLLTWRQLYPAAKPSLREQLFTQRGWQLTADFIFRGGVSFPQLLVIADCATPA